MSCKMQFVILFCVFYCKINGILGKSSLNNNDGNSKSYMDVVRYQPEQVHLSFGETVFDIVVTWSTPDNTNASICQYGTNGYNYTAENKNGPTKFVDEGKAKHTQYIHRVTLSNLLENQRYYYKCGSDLGWSYDYWFYTMAPEKERSLSLAIYGDLGLENGVSLTRLEYEVQKHMYDAILHLGDFAYDLHTNNGELGDMFMRNLSGIAAFVPYMVAPGNHESPHNYSNYKNRFSMPDGWNNMFYSFNMGPVHFIAISTEAYYSLWYGIKPLVFQYQWLEEDLKKANEPENRAKQPWIITFGHRPMYCGNDNGEDCTHNNTVIRKGIPIFGFFGLEELFYNYGVDVAMWGHEHDYERLWPIYNYTIYNGSFAEPYVNPNAPVHIITGAAGNKEGREPFLEKMPEWSAYHTQDYGYTRLNVFSSTKLYFEQVSDDKDGAVIDKFWVIKDKHGPYKLK